MTGIEAEKVGTDAANELLKNLDHGGCVDEFLQDQVNSAYILVDSSSVNITQQNIDMTGNVVVCNSCCCMFVYCCASSVAV